MKLIFDCDGVIVDSMLIHNEVEAMVYRHYGLEIEPRILAQNYAGIPLDQVFLRLHQETGVHIPPDAVAEIERSKVDVMTARLKPIEGVAAMLAELQAVPRALASGSPLESLHHMLGLTGLHNCFAPHIYSSDLVTRGKPFPDLFLYAAEQIGADPHDCLVIEDGVAGIEAAHAAGMAVWGFVGGSHCDAQHAEKLRAAGAATIFDDMRRLPSMLAAIKTDRGSRVFSAT